MHQKYTTRVPTQKTCTPKWNRALTDYWKVSVSQMSNYLYVKRMWLMEPYMHRNTAREISVCGFLTSQETTPLRKNPITS